MNEHVVDCDDELVASITQDVTRFLESIAFFEKLDDVLSPKDSSAPALSCHNSYELSESILRNSKVDESDFADIFCVLRSQGGCCDCEILYNVRESNRLKHGHWKGRASDSVDPVAAQ